MQLTRFQKIALGVAGTTALAIGSFILFAPHAFYASYGIGLGQDPNLLSELRAPGAGLAALGGIILAGIVRTTMASAALVAALTVFLAFPVGRIISLLVDGMPSANVLGALVIEILIAALLLAAFKPRRAAQRSMNKLTA
ncbi:MAG: DUF4345 domain-containing protein [Dinoroseobacter sp.]|nr:DUF4345 domain-containing protein [Dinoroseobacter sp.]